jgi:lipopolysaccharide assembly outer membrane protein LptD (OstA)
VLRAAAAWIACIAWAAPALAGDLPQIAFDGNGEPFRLEADTVEYERGRDVYVASGSVVIRQGGRTLRADWIAFSNTTQRGVASGNVTFNEGPDTLYTSFVQFDVVSLEGVLFDARLDSKSSQFEMSGTEIAKTGEQTYHFENGRFTTCRCEGGGRVPWEIEADRADLEIGGYGTARNTRFEVLGVPVAWLPWMIYPLKTERQTGLLFPELSLGSVQGFSVGLPFFWAARENVNVLLTPGWSVKRGFAGVGATEYVLGEESAGRVAGAYHRDQDIHAHSPSEPFGRDRWAAWGEQDLFLPGAVRLKSSFAFTSDNQYPSDFGELGAYRNDRFLESTAFATRGFGADGRFVAIAGARHADDLQSPDDSDRDDFVLQRVPELSFSVLPQPAPLVPRIVPALDVQYVHFRSDVSRDAVFEDSGIDGLLDAQERGPDGADPGSAPDLNQDNVPLSGGTQGDGIFQEGEPLVDRGSRLWLTPRLGAPLRLGDFAELYPEVGWSQLLYDSDAMGLEQRGLATARAELRTRLRRRFGDAVTHLLEPRIGWALVESVSRSDEPLFVPRPAVAQRRLRELELESVTLDPSDQIEEFNGVTVGVANRFWGRLGKENAPRFFADVLLSSQYDFADGEFGLIVLDGRAFPFERTTARVNLGFDPEEANVGEILLEAAQAFGAGHRVGLRYRYLRDVPRFFEDFPYVRERFRHVKEEFDHVNQIDLYLRISITESWAVTYVGSYSFERSLVLRNRGGIEYFSRCRCWAVRLEIEQDRERGVEFGLFYTLVGLGDDRRRPFEPAGVPGFGLLDDTGRL